MAQVKLSVIVPCYNVEAYVGRRLDSLLGQTLRELEIICVNDASEDGTMQVLRNYQLRYPGRLKVLDRMHEGASMSREAGIRVAAGDYIGFCDADDTADPQMYESLYQAAVQGGACMAVCGYRRIIKGAVVANEMTGFGNCVREVGPGSGWLAAVNTGLCNKLFVRKLLDRRTRMAHPPRVMEDVMVLLSLYPHLSRIAFVQKPLYSYCINDNSSMAVIVQSDLLGLMESWKELRACVLAQNPAFENLIDLAAFMHLGVSAPLHMLDMPNKPLKDNYRMLQECLQQHFGTLPSCPFLQKGYVKQNPCLKFTRTAWQVSRAHMLLPALRCYRLLTETFKFDLKW